MQGYLEHYFFRLWEVVVNHGLPLTGLLLTAIVLPRVGRMAVRIIESRLDEKEESTKARLALAGALVYVFQAVAYFLIIIAALSNIGVPPLGAAIPATVISAAVGFGAQSIIGDFLAGFFILSEKQFGVGDYVSFDGVAGIEGTVVSLTLRTTKVRTPTGEVVMVPNGSAGVVTNFSQDWSRAVVDIEIPVHEGETLPDISSRVKQISQAALGDSAIASDVVGELEVLPATGIVAPTVAGQPWQVAYRVLVEVNPARQWAVERAIRSALISAFWDHYNLSTDITGFGPAAAPLARADAALADAPSAQPHDPAEVSALAEDAVANASDAPDTPGTAGTHGAAAAAETEKFEAPTPKGAGTTENVEEIGESEQFERAAVTGKDDGPGTPADSAAAADSEQEDGGDSARGIWRADTPESKWEAFWTMGGRVRASTTGLFAGLGAVIVLILASANPDGVDAGWLSPAHWSKAPGAPSGAMPSSQAPVNPSAPATDEPQESAPVEPTATTEPTGAEAPDSAAENGAGQNGAGQNGAGETSGTERRDRRDRDERRSTPTEDAGSTPTQNAPGSTLEPQEPTAQATAQATAGQGAAQDTGTQAR